MKTKIFTTMATLCCSGFLLAQTPFAGQGAVWKESHTTFIGLIDHFFTLCGDTIIEGNQYSKVLELAVDSNLNVTGSFYRGGIRSGGSVVRYKSEFPNDEYVLFDFSLEPGNVIELNLLYDPTETTPRTVDSVNVQLLAGKMRRVIYFKPTGFGAVPEYWIEGIGSSYGLLGRGIDEGGDIGFDLLCYGFGDEYLNLTLIECFLPEMDSCQTINGADEVPLAAGFSVSPNPVSHFAQVRYLGESPFSGSVELLTLEGRPAGKFAWKNSLETDIDLSGLAAGVYFLKICEDGTGRSEVLKVVVGPQ